MSVKAKRISVLFIAIILILISLWITGILGLWVKGMASIVGDTKEFSDKNGCVLQGEYSISISLDDLQSNVGKEIYNDGDYRIYVSSVDNTGDINYGGYRIGFRACGQYSLDGASLISGVQHITIDGNAFTHTMSAKLAAEYNGRTYDCPVFGMSGINYKNGDDFSFYLFPGKAYYNDGISLNEKGTVYLTISDLYTNIWTRK